MGSLPCRFIWSLLNTFTFTFTFAGSPSKHGVRVGGGGGVCLEGWGRLWGRLGGTGGADGGQIGQISQRAEKPAHMFSQLPYLWTLFCGLRRDIWWTRHTWTFWVLLGTCINNHHHHHLSRWGSNSFRSTPLFNKTHIWPDFRREALMTRKYKQNIKTDRNRRILSAFKVKPQIFFTPRAVLVPVGNKFNVDWIIFVPLVLN